MFNFCKKYWVLLDYLNASKFVNFDKENYKSIWKKEISVYLWNHRFSYKLINTGLGIDLLPNAIKPFSEPKGALKMNRNTNS